MSDAPDVHDAIVIGAGFGGQCAGIKLREAGITNFLRLSREVVSSVFDDRTHTWTLHTRDGESYCARVVIADRAGDRHLLDDMQPYLGVAVRGFPNYFLITGSEVEAQVHYIIECLKLMKRTGSTRIEVRRSTQRVFNDRIRAKRSTRSYLRQMRSPVPSAFDLSSHTGVEDEVYDGRAIVRIGYDDHEVRVRLTGHLDPIDGRYHWQGLVFGELPDAKLPQPVTLTIGERAAEARLVERTPWGSYSVAGVGAPPFTLADFELSVPDL
jgi:hypothetical protein